MSEPTREQIQVGRDRCPYCHQRVEPDQPKAACDSCLAWHHADCWAEYGACAACAAGELAGREAIGPRCNWKGWRGTSPDCARAGTPREGSAFVLCTEHDADFTRGRRWVAPILLGVLGFLCVLGSGSLMVQIAGKSRTSGIVIAGIAVLASMGLYMIWLAWARWPAKPSPDDAVSVEPPPEESPPPEKQEEGAG